MICFGPSHRFAMAATTRFKVIGIVNENNQFNQLLYDFAILKKIKYHPILSKEQFKNLSWQAELGLSFGFGQIFDEAQIHAFERGIWNIHPGKLPEYRGRHTVGWALINGETELTVSLHAINAEIDKGMCLSEAIIPISELEDQTEIEKKIETVACGNLLDAGIKAELSGKKGKIADGPYLPPLTDKWNTIDPREVEGEFLFRLMKTKKNYGGITVGDKRYTQCQFVFEGARETYQDGEFFICKDEVEVYLK